jgi:MutS-like protein
MMAQYRRIKGELPRDALLLFRLGDFYEMFFEDATIGAQLLNVALTKRGVIPMCGIPFHAASNYIGRLLRAGRKVAICDQVEEARPGQLVNREVTQILSPGTHFDERILQAERNNFSYRNPHPRRSRTSGQQGDYSIRSSRIWPRPALRGRVPSSSVFKGSDRGQEIKSRLRTPGRPPAAEGPGTVREMAFC